MRCDACAALARDGHEVVGVDVAAAKIDEINAGRSPVLEPGVDEIIAEAVGAGRLRATDDPADGAGEGSALGEHRLEDPVGQRSRHKVGDGGRSQQQHAHEPVYG